MFTDFKDFTIIGEKVSAELLVDEIHYCFSAFDVFIQKYKSKKLKPLAMLNVCQRIACVESYTCS